MTPPAMPRSAPAVEGLRRHARQRSVDARAAIEEALLDLRREHQEINVSSVARRAGVSRKTVYNHNDLFDRIRNHRPAPRAVVDPPPRRHDPITAALRNELANQKARYEAQLATLKAQLRQRDKELAAAHGALHRAPTRGDRPGASPDPGPHTAT